MKKWFGRLWRRYVCPTESLLGTWGLYCEYGVYAKEPFYSDCTLRDCWMILEPENSGYWDERGEMEKLYWHRIGCRRIAVYYPGLYPFRKIVRLTHDELWLKTAYGNKDWHIECYRRGTPPPDPDTLYKRYCASLDSADRHQEPNRNLLR